MQTRKPPKPRNPAAAELVRNGLYRTKVMRSVEERALRQDPWERLAKHKNKADTQERTDDP